MFDFIVFWEIGVLIRVLHFYYWSGMGCIFLFYFLESASVMTV